MVYGGRFPLGGIGMRVLIALIGIAIAIFGLVGRTQTWLENRKLADHGLRATVNIHYSGS